MKTKHMATAAGLLLAAFTNGVAQPTGETSFTRITTGAIAPPIETPITRDEKHRAERRHVDAELLQQRTFTLHPVETPPMTERVEHRQKPRPRPTPAEFPFVRMKAALLRQTATNDPLGVASRATSNRAFTRSQSAEIHQGTSPKGEYHVTKDGNVKAGKNGEGAAVITANTIVWEIPSQHSDSKPS